MKKLLPALFLIILAMQESKGQTLTRMQSWGLDFESIAWANEHQGIMVGERLVAYTVDGGASWEEALQKFDLRFYDLVYLEEGKAVAVGENGTIYGTLDGGKSWQKKVSGTQNDLLSITKASGSLLFAVGENGEIVTSADGGENWEKMESSTSLQLNDITFIGENTGFVVVDDGSILKTQDLGNTWTVSLLPETDALYGIEFADELIGYAVGAAGRIVKTQDGGQSWSVLSSPTANTLRTLAINPLDAGNVLFVGDTAIVIRTANAGGTFTKPNLGASNVRNLKGIAFRPGDNTVTAAGQDGYLIHSANGGARWTQVLAGIRNHLSSADFKNVNAGFIAGENGGVWLTSNGAVSLTYRPLPEAIPIETVDFWNTATGYTGSAGGKIFRTTNSGRTWNAVFNPADRTISGFYLFSTAISYIAGSQGYISRSYNSGQAWDQTIPSNTIENLKDVMFFDYQVGFAIGDRGQISWSDGGTVWQNLPKITDKNLNALATIDANRAFVVGDGGVILKTDDQGKTWAAVESGTSKTLKSVDFFGGYVGFIAGEEGLILVTSDGGITWSEAPSGTLRNLNSVSAGTDQKAYFVGDDGTVLAYSCVPPVGNLGDITGDTESCQVITTYSVPGLPEPGSEIVWRIDGGEILSGQGSNQIEVNWTSPGRNAVLVSRSNLCGTAETSSLEVTVTDNPPTDRSIAGDGISCEHSSLVYSLPQSEGFSHTWTVTGGEIMQGQGTHEVTIQWNEHGTQQVTVISENACGSTEPVSKTVEVNSIPTPPDELSGEARVGLGEQVYQINPVAGLNYRWSVPNLGGRILSGQGSGTIVVVWENEGDFELTVEAQNECGFSAATALSVNVNIITALEPTPDANLKIYPIPSQGSVTISDDGLDAWSSLLVTNAIGQRVAQLPISAGQKEIYLENLPKGLLLIRLHGKNGILVKKILVR